VESLIEALDNDKPITEAVRQRVVETLHGMVHTISALTMIINRSVDASCSKSNSGRGFRANRVPVDLEKIMDEIVAFSKWQADGTGIDVVMEPLPTNLPDEIMADEKWLKDDLLCVASNAVKFSRSNQKVPAVMRVAIVPTPTDGISKVSSSQSVQFTFVDSGYPLPEESLTNLFKRPKFSERMSVGGLGLGMYCLSEHMDALEVKMTTTLPITSPDVSMYLTLFIAAFYFVPAFNRDNMAPGNAVMDVKALRYGSAFLSSSPKLIRINS